MRFRKIGTKLMTGILVPVILAMVLLTVISAGEAEMLISEQTQEWMRAELTASEASIIRELSVISNTVNNISGTISSGYKSTTQYNLEKALQQVVAENDSIYGSGIWFEPNVFKVSAEYMGPYAYWTGERKDGEKEVAVTYDRSKPEYDYFHQDYYLLGQQALEPTFTSPYYDETSGLVLITCTMPMHNMLGNFIGCVTVDMELTTIQDMIREIRIGENGRAILVAGDSGVYLGNDREEKVTGGVSILDEENATLAEAGREILNQSSGITGYTEQGEEYLLYYDTIPEVNWKIVIGVPQSQLNAPIVRLVKLLAVVGIAAAVIAVAVILLQVRNISGSIRKVQQFAGTLAEGDFSIPAMPITRQDELGRMGQSLNTMYENNKKMLGSISSHAGVLNVSSEKLSSAAEELLTRFEQIEVLMHCVSEAMMATGSATQEVNASTGAVSSSVYVLAEEAEKSMSMVEAIRERARQVEQISRASYDNALRLSGEYEKNLQSSIENAQVVESVGKLAEVISGIAEQINLLSLNASIEAARAGEAGRGFAVVATEIGRLAGDTSNAVEGIQKTIDEVKQAFSMLTEDSRSLLGFLKETVTPDYDKFVGVGKQYGADAESIEESTARISDMAENIESIMGEVANAVQNIAESAQETADNSSQIMETMGQVSGVVEQVSEMAGSQEEIAGDLHDVVSKFKLN